MIDEQYSDEDLVAVYDILNSATNDHRFYLQLPDGGPLRVLDIGCGTGVLAVQFAQDGHKVSGIDPACAMIEFAKHREGGDSVDWHCASITEFNNAYRFDLITMTGHAFQCLHEDEEILQLFRSVVRLLDNKGRFVFETRNPAFRAWLKWEPEYSLVKSMTTMGELVETFHEVTSVTEKTIDFYTTYRFVDSRKKKKCHTRLRFAGLAELTDLAGVAGLAVDVVYGDWDKSQLTDSSPEIICCLRKK